MPCWPSGRSHRKLGCKLKLPSPNHSAEEMGAFGQSDFASPERQDSAAFGGHFDNPPSGGVWDQFMGHPRAASVLKGAAGRPTGTYLFVGSPGVGKRNAARVFAAALVCPEACGECNTCRRVLAGLHPDVTILQPEGYTFPVEVLRATAQAASQTPIEAEHRVFIIQEADRIPERSQNALLKALEEPNRSVIWILLAHAVQPFLPTILSRCQIVDFPPIAEAAMLALLQTR